MPTGFESLRARPQPTVHRVAAGFSTGGPRVLLSVSGGASAPNSRQDPDRRRARGSRPTAQARRRGLGVSPGVVGRRGNRGAYVPRVRCVAPNWEDNKPIIHLRAMRQASQQGTYERIPWYPLYVPHGGAHPRMYPARTTTDGAHHHSMKQHSTKPAKPDSQSHHHISLTSRTLCLWATRALCF